MDTITHGIAGTLIGKAFFSEREGRIGTAAVALGSIFPDSDILLNPFYSDRIQFLRIHRGITHSLIALPFFSLLFGYLIGKFAHARSRWFSLACLFAIGMASHIFLDLITSYGTMIWSPVSNARYYWDMTFIVDIVFTTIALLPQLIAWSYSDRTRTMRRAFGVWIVLTLLIAAIAAIVAPFQVMIPMWSIGAGSALIALALWFPALGGRGFAWARSSYCTAGVIVLAIYTGACWMAHRAALQRVKEYAMSAGLSPRRIAALPAPPSLLHWSCLIESIGGVYRAAIDLAAPVQRTYSFYPNAPDNRFIQAAESVPDAKTYLWFARFPWLTYESNSGMHIVEMRDVQFLFPQRGNRAPFTFRVLLDDYAHVLKAGLLER